MYFLKDPAGRDHLQLMFAKHDRAKTSSSLVTSIHDLIKNTKSTSFAENLLPFGRPE